MTAKQFLDFLLTWGPGSGSLLAIGIAYGTRRKLEAYKNSLKLAADTQLETYKNDLKRGTDASLETHKNELRKETEAALKNQEHQLLDRLRIREAELRLATDIELRRFDEESRLIDRFETAIQKSVADAWSSIRADAVPKDIALLGLDALALGLLAERAPENHREALLAWAAALERHFRSMSLTELPQEAWDERFAGVLREFKGTVGPAMEAVARWRRDLSAGHSDALKAVAHS